VGNWTGPLRFVPSLSQDYDANLYLRMLTNSNARWLTEQQFERELDSSERQARPADRFFLRCAGSRCRGDRRMEPTRLRCSVRFDAKSGAGPLVCWAPGADGSLRRHDSPDSAADGSSAGGGDREERGDCGKDAPADQRIHSAGSGSPWR